MASQFGEDYVYLFLQIDFLPYCAYSIIHGSANEFKRDMTVKDDDLETCFDYSSVCSFLVCHFVFAHCLQGDGPCLGTLGYGGGVFFAGDSCAKAHFEDVQFVNNVANVSGGAYFTQNTDCGDAWCVDCDYSGNEVCW